jgi:hypothetical protein
LSSDSHKTPNMASERLKIKIIAIYGDLDTRWIPA